MIIVIFKRFFLIFENTTYNNTPDKTRFSYSFDFKEQRIFTFRIIKAFL